MHNTLPHTKHTDPLNFWLVAVLWCVLGWTAWRVLPKYKLDVHYQANGNEVDFSQFKDQEVIGGDVGDGGSELVKAELDEENDEQWADIWDARFIECGDSYILIFLYAYVARDMWHI